MSLYIWLIKAVSAPSYWKPWRKILHWAVQARAYLECVKIGHLPWVPLTGGAERGPNMMMGYSCDIKASSPCPLGVFWPFLGRRLIVQSWDHLPSQWSIWLLNGAIPARRCSMQVQGDMMMLGGGHIAASLHHPTLEMAASIPPLSPSMVN